KITINCLSMAGPQSLVLIENQGSYFYYRGISYEWLSETYLKFGDPVEVDITKYLELKSSNIPKIVSKDGFAEYYDPRTERMLPISSFIEYLSNIEDISDIDTLDMIFIL